jgi:heat shock protein HslJ
MNPSPHRIAATLAIASLLTASTAMSLAGSALDLNGTVWLLSSPPARAAGSTPTLRFDGGQAQGTDGCNRYTVSYTTRGSTLRVGPRAASTQMACPPAVRAQAEEFMSALTGARTYRVEGGTLRLLSASGEVLATLAPQSQSLVGTSWRASGINNGRGAVASRGDSTVMMDFTADGKVGGSAGCNRYSATFESDGAKLRLSLAATTRRMCTSLDVMEQEQAFLRALESVAAMRLEGDRLEMRRADGAIALIPERNIAP